MTQTVGPEPTLHAVVTGVREEKLGDALATAVTLTPTTGPTSLTVYDVADFSEDGGFLQVGPVIFRYIAIDDDTNTITMVSAMVWLLGTINLAVDTEVYVWDDANNQVASRYIATVSSVDGSDADPIEAVVDQALLPSLSQVMRGPGTGESVTISRDGSQMQVVGVHGRAFALAALQLLQGGMTTRVSDGDAGVDILGVDSGAPGLYLYDSDGDVVMQIADDLAGGVFKFWTRGTFETGPGAINPIITGSQPGLSISSPSTAGGQTVLNLFNLAARFLQPSGAFVEFQRDVIVDQTLSAAHIESDNEVSAGTNVTASGSVTGNKLFAASPDTTTSAANVRYLSGGQAAQVTSLTKHKHNPKPVHRERLQALLEVPVVDWVDAAEKKANKGRVKGLRRIPGVLAEDVAATDPGFADYDADGEVAGVLYDRLALAQIQALLHRVEQLEGELAQLKKES